ENHRPGADHSSRFRHGRALHVSRFRRARRSSAAARSPLGRSVARRTTSLKNSTLRLILGGATFQYVRENALALDGAALQRCGNRTVLTKALASEVTPTAPSPRPPGENSPVKASTRFPTPLSVSTPAP